MVSLIRTLIVLILCGVSVANIHNFISFDALKDGETEKLVHFNGVTAKETSVIAHGDDLGQSLRLRQVTDGVHFIQLIYSGDGVLRDCEYIRQRQAVQSFLESIHTTVESRGNVTSLDGIQLPQDVADWLDYQKLKDQCRRNHKQLKRLARRRMHGSEHQKKKANRDVERSRRSLVDYMLVPGTKWCGHEHRASAYTDLGAFASTDICCRRHDRCQLIIPGFSRNYQHFNFRPFTLSHCTCDRRRKRDLMDLLRVPGTKWCGKGYSAKKYPELGGYGSADKCCRFHDTACPFYIPGLEERFGLFNWRISSLMHCTCDRRFRSCLKMADTGVANLVGKLFFNVVQTKCFVLKPEKICVKRSWWGKCQKLEYRKQAHIRDNTPY